MSRVEQYRECAAQGMSMAQTAQRFGVTRTAVRMADKRNSLGFIKRQVASGRDLVEVRARMEEMASRGKLCREMSVALGAPIMTVRRWVHQWRIKLVRASGARKPLLEIVKDLVTAKEMDDLLLLKRRGYTFRDAFVALRRPDLLAYLPEKKA